MHTPGCKFLRQVDTATYHRSTHTQFKVNCRAPLAVKKPGIFKQTTTQQQLCNGGIDECRVVKAKPTTGSDSNGRLTLCVVPSNPVIILRTKLVSIEHSMNDVNLTECNTFVNAFHVERYVLTTRHSGQVSFALKKPDSVDLSLLLTNSGTWVMYAFSRRFDSITHGKQLHESRARRSYRPAQSIFFRSWYRF